MTTPMITAGMPVAMNTHSQPFRPIMPSRSSSAPPTVEPTALASALQAMNSPTMRPRYICGNHSVSANSTPGKKPASAAPSRKRRM